MSIYTVHGGHAKQWNKNSGAVGYCYESTVDRQIKDAVKHYLEADNNVVYDCTVDSGLTASSIISAIKKKINSYTKVTANISIHLNASTKSRADGKTKGSEVLINSTSAACKNMAIRICNNLNNLGFKNRGIKQRTDLGVLKGIKNGGHNLLVECFFCDDEDDYKLAQKVGYDTIGKAIAEGIVGHSIVNDYMFGGLNYGPVFDALYYVNRYPDLMKAIGTNPTALFNHFCNYGMKEGRQGCADFSVIHYRAAYSDLQIAFGNNLPAYYRHYLTNGIKEGRSGR